MIPTTDPFQPDFHIVKNPIIRPFLQLILFSATSVPLLADYRKSNAQQPVVALPEKEDVTSDILARH